VDTNVSLDEVQYELSAFSHLDSLNVLTNVRKQFKQNIYTPGVWEKEKVLGVLRIRTFSDVGGRKLLVWNRV